MKIHWKRSLTFTLVLLVLYFTPLGPVGSALSTVWSVFTSVWDTAMFSLFGGPQTTICIPSIGHECGTGGEVVSVQLMRYIPGYGLLTVDPVSYPLAYRYPFFLYAEFLLALFVVLLINWHSLLFWKRPRTPEEQENLNYYSEEEGGEEQQ